MDIQVKIISVHQVGLLGNEKPMSVTRHHDRQLRYFMSVGAQRVEKIMY